MRKLVLTLACRNSSSRLYAKPLQIIDFKRNITILDFILKRFKKLKIVKDIVLCISKSPENKIYQKIARENNIKFILGDDYNVLKRLITGAELTKATDILRITSESPLTYLENFNFYWKNHVANNFDASFMDNVIDGTGYEIINIKSLNKSNKLGSKLDRSELCSRYIRTNRKKFNIFQIPAPKYLKRNDLRLTVDYPEDLILIRKIFRKLNTNNLDFIKIVKFISQKKNQELIKNYVSNGYKNMYL